ncbi:MAG: hypothetical protein MZV49_22925 [Rhodopseudomonas palustris]|nr:hypothetical protein [Rhodopseudomonas palustris]
MQRLLLRPTPRPRLPSPEDAAPAAAKAAAEKAAVEKSAADKAAEPAAPRGSSPILPLLSGAVGAALVLGGAWFAVGQNLPLTPQSGDSAALESLTARLASVEAKANAAASAPAVASTAAPVAAEPDPALIKRIDTLEKSLTALHDELAATKDKTVQLSAALGNLKPAATSDATPAEPSTAEAAAPATPSVPAATAAELAELGERLTKLQAAVAALPPPPAPVDLAPVNERLSKLEVAVDKPPPVLDDSGLRRVVAAALLESAVQHGEAYAGLLGTAKSLAPDPARAATAGTVCRQWRAERQGSVPRADRAAAEADPGLRSARFNREHSRPAAGRRRPPGADSASRCARHQGSQRGAGAHDHGRAAQRPRRGQA